MEGAADRPGAGGLLGCELPWVVSYDFCPLSTQITTHPSLSCLRKPVVQDSGIWYPTEIMLGGLILSLGHRDPQHYGDQAQVLTAAPDRAQLLAIRTGVPSAPSRP